MFTISVVIPTFNRAALVAEAVASALQQTVAPCEVLVCDDGSTDGTAQRLEQRFPAPTHPVRVLKLPHSGLPAVARNAGLREARGDLIALLDSDDTGHPQRLARQLAVIDGRPDTGLVCSNAWVVDGDGADRKHCYFAKTLPSGPLSLATLLDLNYVIASSALVRRNLVGQVGGFAEDPGLKASEDYDLWLRMAAISEVRYLAEPLVYYRDAPGTSVRGTQTAIDHASAKVTINRRLRRFVEETGQGDAETWRAIRRQAWRSLGELALACLTAGRWAMLARTAARLAFVQVRGLGELLGRCGAGRVRTGRNITPRRERPAIGARSDGAHGDPHDRTRPHRLRTSTMRILYVGMKYDYGQRERGLSFEHHNFFSSLHHLGHEILYFDFTSLMQQHGRRAMNRRLGEVVRAERPDLMFACLFTDQFDYKTIRRISDAGQTTTFNWFCDDHWRFENFSRHWAPCFHWVVTTARSAVPKYEAMGYDRAIKSQWACNHHVYRKLDLPLTHDVSFVGQPHGNRREIVQRIRAAGIDVRAWGLGWESGRIDQQAMIRVFNQSRINLNLSNSSVDAAPAGGLVARLRHRISAAVGLATAKGPRAAADNLEQIKGRNFEIPGCGGFVMTGHADNLETYYADGTEIAIFQDEDELIEKLRFYLDHEPQRAAIAAAGYQRTLQEHTYAHRFHEIFTRMGIPTPAPGLAAAPGEVTEIP